jgi:hypothetical protein
MQLIRDRVVSLNEKINKVMDFWTDADAAFLEEAQKLQIEINYLVNVRPMQIDVEGLKELIASPLRKAVRGKYTGAYEYAACLRGIKEEVVSIGTLQYMLRRGEKNERA